MFKSEEKKSCRYCSHVIICTRPRQAVVGCASVFRHIWHILELRPQTNALFYCFGGWHVSFGSCWLCTDCERLLLVICACNNTFSWLVIFAFTVLDYSGCGRWRRWEWHQEFSLFLNFCTSTGRVYTFILSHQPSFIHKFRSFKPKYKRRET